MSELKNQMEIGNFMPKEPKEPIEGYDKNGNLMDYTPPKPRAEPAQTPARSLEIIAAEINAIKRQARGVVISAALEIGKRLIEAKNQCPRGRWSEWLSANVDYSERKAQDLMRLYEGYGDDVPTAIASLTYTQALQLLSLSEGEREAMAERVEAEGLSTRQLEAELKAARERQAEMQTRIEGLEADKQADNRKIYVLHQQLEARDTTLQRRDAELAEADKAIRSAHDTIDAMRQASAQSEQSAAAAEQAKADAINRANATQRKLAEAEAKIRELEARPAQAVEVSGPSPADREQIEALQAEIARLRAEAEAREKAGEETGNREQGTGTADDQRRLALALRVRLAVQDCAGALNGAVNAAAQRAQAITATLEQLRALDHARAARLTDEVWALHRLAEACQNAMNNYTDEQNRKGA